LSGIKCEESSEKQALARRGGLSSLYGRQGWSLSEIVKRAAEERALHEKTGSAEPADLVSGGDMKKILEEPNDDPPQ